MFAVGGAFVQIYADAVKRRLVQLVDIIDEIGNRHPRELPRKADELLCARLGIERSENRRRNNNRRRNGKRGDERDFSRDED